MIIYPAIDIKNGKCVRLMQGDFEKTKVYNEDPFEVAKQWQDQGGEFLHMVDLDGAKDGKGKNLDIIIRIAKNLKIPVQLGGGIRSIETVDMLLNQGINRVILGTSAIEDKEFLMKAIKMYKEKIVVGIDARDKTVAIEGWVKDSGVNAIEFIKELVTLGVKNIVYTDIKKDGMLSGPNFEELEEIIKLFKINIIASGGVTTIDDLKKLKDMGASGAIVGKALYEGGITLPEIIKNI